jgi:hypothetical protein
LGVVITMTNVQISGCIAGGFSAIVRAAKHRRTRHDVTAPLPHLQ